MPGNGRSLGSGASKDEANGSNIRNAEHQAEIDIGVLIAGITDENGQDFVDMGKPAGQEVW